MNWEIGIDIYTLTCIKWITNKNLLYKKIIFKKKKKKKKKVKWGRNSIDRLTSVGRKTSLVTNNRSTFMC